jgi:type II secretory pathway component GspD/PulD (secretin)
MVTTRPHRRQGDRIWGGVASLLVILLLVSVTRPMVGASRLQVAVHQGRLSVNLVEADLGEVLAQIREQAGIPILISPSARERVSIQFRDLALDQGLRRILQRVSRSYAIRYAPSPAGDGAILEVRVFEEAHIGSPLPVVAERAGEEPAAEAGQRFVDALRQRQAAAPAVAREGESAAASRFSEALERNAAPAPGWTDAPVSDGARDFRDALEGTTGATPR